MIKIIFILILLYYLIKYVISHLITLKTDNDRENDVNYWMFTYDFKEKKKDSIFDKDSEEALNARSKKNKLILILYLSVILAFFFVNSLVAHILLLVLK